MAILLSLKSPVESFLYLQNFDHSSVDGLENVSGVSSSADGSVLYDHERKQCISLFSR